MTCASRAPPQCPPILVGSLCGPRGQCCPHFAKQDQALPGVTLLADGAAGPLRRPSDASVLAGPGRPPPPPPTPEGERTRRSQGGVQGAGSWAGPWGDSDTWPPPAGRPPVRGGLVPGGDSWDPPVASGRAQWPPDRTPGLFYCHAGALTLGGRRCPVRASGVGLALWHGSCPVRRSDFCLLCSSPQEQRQGHFGSQEKPSCWKDEASGGGPETRGLESSSGV